MDQPKKIKITDGSITPSTLLLNQMVNEIRSNRMLSQEQITLLRKSKKEISEKVKMVLEHLRTKA